MIYRVNFSIQVKLASRPRLGPWRRRGRRLRVGSTKRQGVYIVVIKYDSSARFARTGCTASHGRTHSIHRFDSVNVQGTTMEPTPLATYCIRVVSSYNSCLRLATERHWRLRWQGSLTQGPGGRRLRKHIILHSF